MFKKFIMKLLEKSMKLMFVILVTIIDVVLFIPALIYGLISGLGLKETFKAFWIDGFYVSMKKQLKELELD